MYNKDKRERVTMHFSIDISRHWYVNFLCPIVSDFTFSNSSQTNFTEHNKKIGYNTMDSQYIFAQFLLESCLNIRLSRRFGFSDF